MQQLYQKRCPECNSENFCLHTTCTVQCGEQRELYQCSDCGAYFSETKNTPLAGLRRSVSFIIMVLEALNDGMSINAACRTLQ
jgi:transposase-like protein